MIRRFPLGSAGHRLEMNLIRESLSRSSLLIVSLPGCRSNCGRQIRRLALLKCSSQKRSYSAINKLKAVGSGIILKAKLSQFVPYEPLNGYSHDDRQHVADE